MHFIVVYIHLQKSILLSHCSVSFAENCNISHMKCILSLSLVHIHIALFHFRFCCFIRGVVFGCPILTLSYGILLTLCVIWFPLWGWRWCWWWVMPHCLISTRTRLWSMSTNKTKATSSPSSHSQLYKIVWI